MLERGYKTNTNLLIKDELHDEVDGLRAGMIIFDERELYVKKNKKYKRCPRCDRKYEEPSAISRKDNKTKICSKCGNEEAILDYLFTNECDIPRID